MEMITLCSLALIFSIIFFISKPLKSSKYNNLPPSPPSLPILGHLHLVTTAAPHRALQALSNKYGAVLYLRFGFRPVLVVSSPSAAEQCFSKNDVIFANRPESLAGKILGYNSTSIGFTPYGAHWRNLRRLTAIQIFSLTSLLHSSAIRAEETRNLVKKLFQGCESDPRAWRKANLNSLYFQLVYDVVIVMVSGKRGANMNHIFEPPKHLDLCDYVPLLRWVGFKGMEKKLLNLHEIRDNFLQGLIDEAREKINGGCSSFEEKRKTYVEELLTIQESEPEYYTDEILKGLIVPMFTAGTHTTALTMEWAMSHLLNHPFELEKARNEIDTNITDPGQLLTDSDLSKLPNLRCIIKETLRLYPVGPLLLPHSSSQDCKIDGFDIPRSTTLMVNAWAIHRDPKVWEEPEKFKPERFNGIEGGFKFVPFGVGRRACPGAGMAMRLMLLVLGTLIQCFEWEREGSEMVDMEEFAGLTLSKVKPLEAMYRPRISMMNLLSQL